MSDDIVTRLRLWASVTEGDHVIEELHRAADEIKRLRAEVNRLTLLANLWQAEFNAAVNALITDRNPTK